MTRRREFSKSVSIEIVKRSMDADGRIRCEKCRGVVKGKQYEIDHELAEELRVDKSKKLTASEGMLLCIPCHRGPVTGKTAADIKIIAKAKRNEAKHLGIKRKKAPIHSAGFPKAPKADKIPVPPPKSLFKPAEERT
jgi:hypothetical protein